MQGIISKIRKPITALAVEARRTQRHQAAYVQRKDAKFTANQPTQNLVIPQDFTLTPAYTAHPTSPLGYDYQIAKYQYSRGVRIKTHLNNLLKGKNPQEIASKSKKLERKLDYLIQESGIKAPKASDTLETKTSYVVDALNKKMASVPVVAPKPLTPEQESNLFLNTVYDNAFRQSDGIIRQQLAKNPTARLPRLFDLRSWAGGDADGNSNVTPKVTRKTIHDTRIKTAKLYQEDIAPLLSSSLPPIQEVAFKANEHLKLIIGGNPVTPAAEQALQTLAETLGGSKGRVLKEKLRSFPLTGSKIDLRQSSEANDKMLVTLVDDILKPQGVLNVPEGKSTTDFVAENRQKVVELLDGNDKAKQAIATAYTASGKENDPAWNELQRMIVAQEYPKSVDRYRISDARDADDVRTLRVFENIAQKVLGKPEKPQTDFILLAETEDDIKRLPDSIKQVLEKKLNLPNQLTVFVGYSDAQKRMGVTGLVTIADTIGQIEKIVQNEKAKGNPLTVVYSHGGGEDIMRNGGKYKADSTEQGRQGAELALFDNFKNQLAITASGKDSITHQGAEIGAIKNTPEGRAALEAFVERGRENFRTLVAHKPETTDTGASITPLGDVTAHLLAGHNTTENPEGEKWFYKMVKQGNKSSRAASKASGVPTLNWDKERAIGVSSLFTAFGTGSQVLGGVPRLDQIQGVDVNPLKNSEVMKDIIYKGLFTAATTDFDRAYQITGQEASAVATPKTLPTTLDKPETIHEAFKQDKEQGAKTLLRNIHIQDVQATRGLAYVHGGDEGLKALDSELNKGKTLAAATESYMAKSTDPLLKTLAVDAKELKKTSGLDLTKLIKDLNARLITDKKVQPQTDAALVLIREEQTVPQALRQFGSIRA